MKTAYAIVSTALENYRTTYPNPQSGDINDERTLSEFIVNVGTYYSPQSLNRALKTVSRFANVFDPDITATSGITALAKAKRALR